jgi:hypothetical protein
MSSTERELRQEGGARKRWPILAGQRIEPEGEAGAAGPRCSTCWYIFTKNAESPRPSLAAASHSG